MEDRRYPDHAPDVVDVEDVIGGPRAPSPQVVEEPHVRRGEVVPGDRADERAQEVRNEVVGLELVAPRAVGAGIQPRERYAQDRREHSRPHRDGDRIQERPSQLGMVDDLLVVAQSPFRAEPQLVEDAEAGKDQREKRQEHRGRHRDGDHRSDEVFLREETTPPLGLRDDASERHRSGRHGAPRLSRIHRRARGRSTGSAAPAAGHPLTRDDTGKRDADRSRAARARPLDRRYWKTFRHRSRSSLNCL